METAAYADYGASQYAASQLANTAATGTNTGTNTGTKADGGGRSGGASSGRGGNGGGTSGGNSSGRVAGRPTTPSPVQQLVIPVMAAPVVAAVQAVNAQAAGAAASLVTAVAAAGISLGETGSPGNRDDRCSTDSKDIIATYAQQVIDDRGRQGLDDLLSPAQWKAVGGEGRRIWRYRGSKVHQLTAKSLNDAYRMADGEPRFSIVRRWAVVRHRHMLLFVQWFVVRHSLCGLCPVRAVHVPRREHKGADGRDGLERDTVGGQQGLLTHERTYRYPYRPGCHRGGLRAASCPRRLVLLPGFVAFAQTILNGLIP